MLSKPPNSNVSVPLEKYDHWIFFKSLKLYLNDLSLFGIGKGGGGVDFGIDTGVLL